MKLQICVLFCTYFLHTATFSIIPHISIETSSRTSTLSGLFANTGSFVPYTSIRLRGVKTFELSGSSVIDSDGAERSESQLPAQSLAEEAERAAREAEEAARRAQDLRARLSKPAATASQDQLVRPSAQDDGVQSELVDPSQLAEEMGAVLSSLQRQRGQASLLLKVFRTQTQQRQIIHCYQSKTSCPCLEFQLKRM